MEDKYLIDFSGDGNVKIADDVIAKIATVTAQQIEGVVETPTGFKSGVADMLGVKSNTKGAKVSVGESEAVIEMFITVEYGKNIINTCKKVQEKVKEAIENMTGLNVIEVNVHVNGISIVEREKTQFESN